MLLCSPSQYRSALMPPLGWGYNKKSFDIWKQTFNQFIHVCNRFFPRCSIVCFIISNSFSSIISFCNPSPSSIWIDREQQFEYIIGYYLLIPIISYTSSYFSHQVIQLSTINTAIHCLPLMIFKMKQEPILKCLVRTCNFIPLRSGSIYS